jgi:hypothetical protein
MDEKSVSSREEIAEQLKRAIRNINRNLYDWKKYRGGKTNFSISYTEVFGVTRNWIVRCLRSSIGPTIADGIFRKGHLFIQVDEENLCLASIAVRFHEGDTYFNRYKATVSEVIDSLDFKSLRYNPLDYEIDGVTQKDEFVYQPYVPVSLSHLDEFKFEIPKS